MDSTSLGSVHGFSVQSESSFVYLRDGCGEPLMIREDGSEPSQPGDCLADIKSRNALPNRVYRRDGRFSMRMDGVGWFGIDPGTSTITVPPTQYRAWLEGAIWGLPVALLVLSRGGVFFHASAVEIDGRAVILTGPGGHRKTTLAAALNTPTLEGPAQCLTATRALAETVPVWSMRRPLTRRALDGAMDMIVAVGRAT